VRQDSDISTQGTAPVYVIDMSEEQINREDVIRRRHVQQDSACYFSVRQDSDISTEGTAPVYVIDMSEEQINREDVTRRRHVLLRCADLSLNHE
jgi:hypothetical protein